MLCHPAEHVLPDNILFNAEVTYDVSLFSFFTLDTPTPKRLTVYKQKKIILHHAHFSPMTKVRETGKSEKSAVGLISRENEWK